MIVRVERVWRSTRVNREEVARLRQDIEEAGLSPDEREGLFQLIEFGERFIASKNSRRGASDIGSFLGSLDETFDPETRALRLLEYKMTDTMTQILSSSQGQQASERLRASLVKFSTSQKVKPRSLDAVQQLIGAAGLPASEMDEMMEFVDFLASFVSTKNDLGGMAAFQLVSGKIDGAFTPAGRGCRLVRDQIKRTVPLIFRSEAGRAVSVAFLAGVEAFLTAQTADPGDLGRLQGMLERARLPEGELVDGRELVDIAVRFVSSKEKDGVSVDLEPTLVRLGEAFTDAGRQRRADAARARGEYLDLAGAVLGDILPNHEARPDFQRAFAWIAECLGTSVSLNFDIEGMMRAIDEIGLPEGVGRELARFLNHVPKYRSYSRHGDPHKIEGCTRGLAAAFPRLAARGPRRATGARGYGEGLDASTRERGAAADYRTVTLERRGHSDSQRRDSGRGDGAAPGRRGIIPDEGRGVYGGSYSRSGRR
jgi:hypothetical protein